MLHVGAAPIDVRAEQDGPDIVFVTWTPPPAPPAAGYQVQVTVGTTTTTTDVTRTSHTISVSQFGVGVYSISVTSLSQQHLPSEAESVEISVRGMKVLVVSGCETSNVASYIPWCSIKFRQVLIIPLR